MIKKKSYNPIYSEWKERYGLQSLDVQNALDELEKTKPQNYQLEIIKKTKIQPKEGDVFLLSPSKNIYFYGRVLKADIQHKEKDIFIHGKSSIIIFMCKTNKIDMCNYHPDYKDLLIRPQIVDESYWTRGYFYTVDNISLDDQEKQLDYGFYSVAKGKYLKETGEEINHQPQILGTYGLATMTGIAYQVRKEIIIDPNILKI